MKYYSILIVAILAGCTTPDQSQESLTTKKPPHYGNRAIHPFIQKSIQAHYPNGIEQRGISFQFRDRFYSCYYDRGTYCFTRSYMSEEVSIQDTLSNGGFFRFLDGELIKLSQEDSLNFMEGLNGVIYFGFLPDRLTDPAVVADSLEPQILNGKKYHLLRVRFTEEEGGEDFDDEFMYWFEWDSYLLDFFSYRYNRDGGGVRFREAINRREIGGLIIQDYLNYKHEKLTIPLDSLSLIYRNSALELLSKIEFTSVKIK